MNLDGGGSTTLVVDGRLVNHPSDGSSRSVSNALLGFLLPARSVAQQ
jgi:exopolysaccharide biosynthesis protein